MRTSIEAHDDELLAREYFRILWSSIPQKKLLESIKPLLEENHPKKIKASNSNDVYDFINQYALEDVVSIVEDLSEQYPNPKFDGIKRNSRALRHLTYIERLELKHELLCSNVLGLNIDTQIMRQYEKYLDQSEKLRKAKKYLLEPMSMNVNHLVTVAHLLNIILPSEKSQINQVLNNPDDAAVKLLNLLKILQDKIKFEYVNLKALKDFKPESLAASHLKQYLIDYIQAYRLGTDDRARKTYLNELNLLQTSKNLTAEQKMNMELMRQFLQCDISDLKKMIFSEKQIEVLKQFEQQESRAVMTDSSALKRRNSEPAKTPIKTVRFDDKIELFKDDIFTSEHLEKWIHLVQTCLPGQPNKTFLSMQDDFLRTYQDSWRRSIIIDIATCICSLFLIYIFYWLLIGSPPRLLVDPFEHMKKIMDQMGEEELKLISSDSQFIPRV